MLTHLRDAPLGADELARMLALDQASVAAALAELELAGAAVVEIY